MQVHGIINYSPSICPFEFGKCGEEGKKLQKIEYLENEKSFSDEIKKHFLQFPGIDSWIQPSLNLGFSWLLKPANLGEPNEQVTQVGEVLEPSLPSFAGSIKTNKKRGFSWLC